MTSGFTSTRQRCQNNDYDESVEQTVRLASERTRSAAAHSVERYSVGLAREHKRSAMTLPVRAPHGDRALCKLSVCQAKVRVRLHVTLPVRAANREGALCKLLVWQANVRVRLTHRRFERRTAQIVVQTVGLAKERTHSAVT